MRVPARDVGFLLPYVLIGGVYIAATLAGTLQGIGLVLVFVLLPIVDALVGTSTSNKAPADEPELERHPYYQALLLLWVPLQLGLIGLGFSRVLAADAPAWQAALLGVPLGLANGGIGITVAHELGHRNRPLDRWAARVLLVSVAYGHFTLEHNRGHHVRVATPEDPATARLGESLYRFLLRTVPSQYAHAWALENGRCRRQHGRALTVRNEMVWLTLAATALFAGAFALGGPAGLAYFTAQCAFAIGLLEAVNYVEHYGLLRERRPDGRYEKVEPRHSWNASHLVTNWLLFALQRHSDHHAFAGRRYSILRHLDNAPQLPAGYPTMILLALVPPLWSRVMDPRVLAARQLGRAPDGVDSAPAAPPAAAPDAVATAAAAAALKHA